MKKQKRIPLKKVLREELKDPDFKFYYEQEKAVSHIARMIRDARQRSEMTQANLAERAGTTQAVIARIESGNDSRIPSLDLLQRIAQAIRARLLVGFEYQASV